jgi:DNA polymerase III delta prime subunit
MNILNAENSQNAENLEVKLFVEKYQPFYFKDFDINQEVIQILKDFIKINNLNILLVGNITSGKTSILNAIVREYYYNIPLKDYENNVLYINNLKEQGIHYYRTEVKTFCQTRSNIQNKKKIIVLDDIDLINEQSQQVFRNCIDKYSNNVHFISSCSNIQKVIENLQSRFNIIKIKSMKKENINNIIQKIKIKENIQIDKESEEFIINISNNTIKNIINYMEKFKILDEPITIENAMQLCCNISFTIFEKYTNYLLDKKLNEAIRVLYEINYKGYSVMDILDNYFAYIKNSNILNEDQKHKIIPFICKYITIFHNIHEDEIELALFTNNLIAII